MELATSVNKIYLFTKLPNSDEEVLRFFYPDSGSSQKKRISSSREIYQTLVGRSKAIVNLAQDVSLHFVDTSCLHNPINSFQVLNEWKGCVRLIKHAKLDSFSMLVKDCDSLKMLQHDAYVSDSKPFLKFMQRRKEEIKRNQAQSSQWMSQLQKHYSRLASKQLRAKRIATFDLVERPEKIPRRISDDSANSFTSRKSSDHVITSRGDAMRRASSLNKMEQNRKSLDKRLEEAETARRNWTDLKKGPMEVLEHSVEHLINGRDSKKLIETLMLLHSDACKKDKGDIHLVALSEVVVNSLLKHQKSLGLFMHVFL